jgi:hypothetical protein
VEIVLLLIVVIAPLITLEINVNFLFAMVKILQIRVFVQEMEIAPFHRLEMDQLVVYAKMVILD